MMVVAPTAIIVVADLDTGVRPEVDAFQLVLGSRLPLDQLRDLAANLRQLFADVAAHVLVDLDDLQLRLGDLALGLG